MLMVLNKLLLRHPFGGVRQMSLEVTEVEDQVDEQAIRMQNIHKERKIFAGNK